MEYNAASLMANCLMALQIIRPEDNSGLKRAAALNSTGPDNKNHKKNNLWNHKGLFVLRLTQIRGKLGKVNTSGKVKNSIYFEIHHHKIIQFWPVIR